MKRVIRLTENELRNMVSESIKQILGESSFYGKNRFEIWYRGYNSRYGSRRDHLIWLTDDISYARAYGNRVEEVTIDNSKLKPASLYDIDEIIGEELDYIDGPTEEEAQELLANNYNCYTFYANSDNSYCVCLWDNSPIVNKRELPKEEFDEIEMYDGFDNKGYDDVF